MMFQPKIRTLVSHSLLWASLMTMVYVMPAYADESLDNDLATLQHAWAHANYQVAESDKESAFKTLSEAASKNTTLHNNAPEAEIWEAIILSGYAKAKGGLGALKLAEKARDLLLAAEKSNPNALQGSVYVTLGSLYYKVPSWPIGFGDKKKAEGYLEKALQLNPAGIDANYFYADFLSNQGEYTKALDYYKRALASPPRKSREDADLGRRKEAEEGMKATELKLK